MELHGLLIQLQKLPKNLDLSDLVIGLTIVAIATSAPEFAVTISAALNDQDSISVGNVLGSNIFNLGIILGFIAFVRPIEISKIALKKRWLTSSRNWYNSSDFFL